MSTEPPADDLASLWKRVRDELEASLPESTFKLWLEPVRVVSAHGSTMYLSAPPSVRAWVERRYAARIASILAAQQTSLVEIGFVEPGAAVPDSEADSAAPTSVPLDSSHSFDRFVIGPANRLAHAAALAVAELPGEAYNPLFLHGPPGLGKTHLLGAIAEYLRRNHPELTVHYTTAERFTTEFVTSLRRDGSEVFKARYRDLDVLLIDDVQVLEGKPRTEEEFVHTFNTLYGQGKQIVLSSDRPPEALSQLAERLRDRFRWGLQVELEAPDLPTRIALLWRMASDSSPDLPEPGVLHEIATRVPENVRVLEGAMTRVLAVASLLSEPLSAPIVRRALGRQSGEPVPSGARDTDAGGDSGHGLRDQRPHPRGVDLAAALDQGGAGAADRHVPGSRADTALADRDRSRLRPRPHHRPARRAHRLDQARARLRNRAGDPQGTRRPGDIAPLGGV